MTNLMTDKLLEAGVITEERIEKMKYTKGKRKLMPYRGALANYKRIYTISNPDNDGIDHINVSYTGKTTLGRKLSPCWKEPFTHPFGRYLSVNIFMNAINVPELPSSLLRQHRNGCIDHIVRKLRLRKVTVPNYWAIVAEGLWYKIQQHDLAKEFRESELPFTSYSIRKPSKDSDYSSKKQFRLINYRDTMIKYIGVLEELRKCLQNGTSLEEFIESIKSAPELDIYDGVPFLTEFNTTEDKEGTDDNDESNEVTSETDNTNNEVEDVTDSNDDSNNETTTEEVKENE